MNGLQGTSNTDYQRVIPAHEAVPDRLARRSHRSCRDPLVVSELLLDRGNTLKRVINFLPEPGHIRELLRKIIQLITDQSQVRTDRRKLFVLDIPDIRL